MILGMLRHSLRHHAFPAEPRSCVCLQQWLKPAPLSQGAAASRSDRSHGSHSPQYECALTNQQVQRDRDGEAYAHCDGHDPTAAKAVQVNAGPNVLAGDDQQADQGEDAVLDGLSSCSRCRSAECSYDQR